MNKRTAHRLHARVFYAFCLSCFFVTTPCAVAFAQKTPAPTPSHKESNKELNRAPVNATPTETVRAFYKALGERRYRDAFAMSIYKPAVESLSDAEFEELRPDFERIAAAVSGNIVITGEQISGDTANVFVKAGSSGDVASPPEAVPLMRAPGGAWIVGEADKQEYVRKKGKNFFLDERIETHHGEVQSMLQRLLATELIYSSQHGGMFGDLNALVGAGLMPKDLLGTESTGYRFHVAVGKDGKSFTGGAEPERYGRTGRLSFLLDASGIKSQDNGGKPIKPASKTMKPASKK
ncbi:MAG: YfbM family protein [Acidobacteria bacterium]|nr:YfbM family protein [Acidobacteriota bacterium]